VSVHITEQLPHQLKVASFGFGLALMPNMTDCSPNMNMELNRSAVIMRFCFFSFPCRARLALRYARLLSEIH